MRGKRKRRKSVKPRRKRRRTRLQRNSKLVPLLPPPWPCPTLRRLACLHLVQTPRLLVLKGLLSRLSLQRRSSPRLQPRARQQPLRAARDTLHTPSCPSKRRRAHRKSNLLHPNRRHLDHRRQPPTYLLQRRHSLKELGRCNSRLCHLARPSRLHMVFRLSDRLYRKSPKLSVLHP